jgi:uncharacterized cupredoxin-like copper-binding protein
MSFSIFFRSLPTSVVAIAVATSLSVAAFAAGKHTGGHGHGQSIGEPGKPEAATRTVEIRMIDNEFKPKSISVVRGETVRFVVINNGEFVHEFNIGTAAMHHQHQKEMLVMMEKDILETDRINHDMMKSSSGHGHQMAHDDPNSVLLEPGKSAEIVWTFNADAALQMACNVPGHYESGMVGKIHLN